MSENDIPGLVISDDITNPSQLNPEPAEVSENELVRSVRQNTESIETLLAEIARLREILGIF